jgi:short subunit dehydrogenase-like uncharacterized protein
VTDKRWMIYGATGFTGTLIAEEARRQGLGPVLAGRSEAKVRALAERLDCEWRVADLADPVAIRAALNGVAAVVHAAGPFVDTSAPMVAACLAAGTHYLDITGEIPVFEAAYALDAAARSRQVVLLPGVGFDVVPTDCLAVHLAEGMPDACRLDIAIAAIGKASAGTAKSALRGLLRGNLVRREGRLTAYPLGLGELQVPFPDRVRWAMPIPWGDLASAWRSTAIPEITTYAALPSSAIRSLQRFGWLANAALPALRPLLARPFLQHRLDAWIARRIRGPDADERAAGRSFVWARVSNRQGDTHAAWLETAEGYHFTAMAAVAAVQRVHDGQLAGAVTPAQAFGSDFVLAVPGSRRQAAPAAV